MTPEAAIEIVNNNFPFPGYMETKNDKYLEIIKVVSNYLQLGANILDFGSGPGDVIAILKTLGYQCSACDDLNDYWANIDDNKNKITEFYNKYNIQFYHIINNEIYFNDELYDMIILNDVLEHLHNSPRSLLNDLVSFIKPEGYLYITVPNLVNIKKRLKVLFGNSNLGNYNFYYWYPDPWRGHIREYTKDDLLTLFTNLDLEIMEISSCHFMAERVLRNTPKFIRIMYRVLTNIFPSWRDSWSIIGKKPTTWLPRKSLSESELKELYGRITD